jgi:1-deoxy-D-xylulose-5-phosphate reductoisomerase
MEGIVVLGATGSIGVSTLAVLEQHPDRYKVIGLGGHRNIDLLARQIRAFAPCQVAVAEGYAEPLKRLIEDVASPPEIFEGGSGQVRLARHPQADRIVAAVVGAAGIEPVIAGLRNGKTVALANKESLVMAGALLIDLARQHSARLLPIDSEHNAVFQSLGDENPADVDHITLTASGGPFRTRPLSEFKDIALEDALRHPNWAMGPKITVDSATMMNKCLEIIEARWLFDMPPEKIKVVVHPQSVIHSLVTFKDGSTLCQMGVPDMRIPIAYCLGFPQRIASGCPHLDLTALGQLTFEVPDQRRFPALGMAYEILALGGGAPAALNGANEELVSLFLKGSIHFTRISSVLRHLVNHLKHLKTTAKAGDHSFLLCLRQLEDAFRADAWGRSFVTEQIARNDHRRPDPFLMG